VNFIQNSAANGVLLYFANSLNYVPFSIYFNAEIAMYEHFHLKCPKTFVKAKFSTNTSVPPYLIFFLNLHKKLISFEP
jgi:hypothetical protein